MRLALFGAGLIGQRHARLVSENERCELAAVIEPNDDLSRCIDAPSFAGLDDFLAGAAGINAAIIATPNNTHHDIALALIERGMPLLVEKPLASSSVDAGRIVAAAEAADVPVLVGHHRRYHHATAMAKATIDAGGIGRILATQVTWCLRKPDNYFEAGAWRKGAGGGPVWINLIHEIDLLRYFLGEVTEVTAMLENLARGNAVEDTGTIALRFVSGAMASVLVSDATPSPWHFEGASGENPNIAATEGDGTRFFGTEGVLAFPSLTKWQHKDTKEGHWGEPISSQAPIDVPPMTGDVALSQQLDHFLDVIAGTANPLVSAVDGLCNILVTEAILHSAETGRTVSLSTPVMS